MHYDIAVLQRRHLIEGLEIYHSDDPTQTLPSCDDLNSCMDGRCPTCGSRLVDTLGAFASSTERHCVGGFLVESIFVSDGCDAKLDLTAVKTSLDEISCRLNDGFSWFIGWFGIFVDLWGGNGRKVGALAFMYSGDLLNPQVISNQVLSERFGTTALKLPFWHAFPDALDFEELLYGYTYASSTRREAEPVLDRYRLAELAQNYGQHRILDRVVTHGLVVEEGKLLPAPGASWPLFLDKFHNPAETRAYNMENRPC